MHLVYTTALSIALSLVMLDAHALQSDRKDARPFVLVAEVRETNHAEENEHFLIRSILINEGGKVIQLKHRVRDGGSLELRGADQSPEAIAASDAYCRHQGLNVVSSGTAVLGRDTVAMLACGATEAGSYP